MGRYRAYTVSDWITNVIISILHEYLHVTDLQSIFAHFLHKVPSLVVYILQSDRVKEHRSLHHSRLARAS